MGYAGAVAVQRLYVVCAGGIMHLMPVVPEPLQCNVST